MLAGGVQIPRRSPPRRRRVPAWYLSASRRRLTTFPSACPPDGRAFALALHALVALPRRGRKRLTLSDLDGTPALDAPLADTLLAAGFVREPNALVVGDARPGVERT